MTRTRLLTMATGTSVLVATLALTAATMHAGQPGPGGPGGRGGFGRFGGQGPQGPGGPMGGAPMLGLPRPLAAQLNLSDAQREQIRGIMQQHRNEAEQLGQRLGAAERALHQAVQAEAFDETAIRAAAADAATARTDMAVFQGRVHADVYQVLTPEQQAKARELKAQMEQRGQERAKRMQERRQGRGERRSPAE